MTQTQKIAGTMTERREAPLAVLEEERDGGLQAEAAGWAEVSKTAAARCEKGAAAEKMLERRWNSPGE
jgi:hypothetical protein